MIFIRSRVKNFEVKNGMRRTEDPFRMSTKGFRLSNFVVHAGVWSIVEDLVIDAVSSSRRDRSVVK